MKLEVGKKYRVEDHNEPWEVMAVDKRGIAWGLLNGVMAFQGLIKIIGEWQDKPDPGEGWRLLKPDEYVEAGDEYYSHANKAWLQSGSPKTCGGKQGDFPYRRRIAPQYVPYTWDDRDELRGRWYRQGSLEVAIKSFQNLGSGEFRINNYSPEKFLELCEWLDGTPCGKKVV